MANEITIDNGFQITKDAIPRIPKRSTNATVSMGGIGTSLLSQLIGITGWTALDLGTVTAPAAMWVHNLGPTNPIKLAVKDDGTGIFASVPYGLAQPICAVSGVTYYGQAVTTAVEVEIAAG